MNTRYNLNRLNYFVATIDAGTITAAAESLGVSKAVVSKQLQMLEQELKTPLLLRNTRRLQATEAGLAFYQQAKSALIQVNNAYERVQERDQQPRGRLRITAPVDYGVSHVAPCVARFRDEYPEVSVDLQLTDARIDIVEERYDLAFRIGWLKDSSNRARKLLTFNAIPVCTAQTRDQSAIQTPMDLVNLPFVQSHSLDGKRTWDFYRKTKPQSGQSTAENNLHQPDLAPDVHSVPVNIVLETNISMAIIACVKAAKVFTILPDILVQKELDAGELVQLLPEWSLLSGGIYTVTPPGRVRSHALQRFLALVHSHAGLHEML